MTYQTEIHIWSAIGNTPITNRKGNYCDLLFKGTIKAASPADAVYQAKKIAKETPGAYSGHYSIKKPPNHNTADRFFTL